jgi:hypothetical protein
VAGEVGVGVGAGGSRGERMRAGPAPCQTCRLLIEVEAGRAVATLPCNAVWMLYGLSTECHS